MRPVPETSLREKRVVSPVLRRASAVLAAVDAFRLRPAAKGRTLSEMRRQAGREDETLLGVQPEDLELD